jgi:sigma-54 specific flagellar transcriptional regulator A
VVARSNATVLLLGETGTGKEVFARDIHAHSLRAEGPFVAVNCGAIPENLLEAELFGHVKGAFTGADRARRGRVAAAEGGTLFLDEVGELSLPLQVKLLRLLQERTYEPVGDSTTVTADFRLIVATNKDLEAAVEAGTFRRDLFYRLFVCPVELPPLRARVVDVEPLFVHFWNQRGDARSIDPAVFDQLRAYPWPGNVRELENVVERLAVCAAGPRIYVDDLPPAYRGMARAQPFVMDAPRVVQDDSDAADNLVAPPAAWSLPAPIPGRLRPMDLTALLRDIEATYIDAALAQTDGNRQAAAQLLGLQRTTLVEKLRRRRQREGAPVDDASMDGAPVSDVGSAA